MLPLLVRCDVLHMHLFPSGTSVRTLISVRSQQRGAGVVLRPGRLQL